VALAPSLCYEPNEFVLFALPLSFQFNTL